MKQIDDMEVIQSFTIDHMNLEPGIYISREDQNFTTFDLRITKPNWEPAMTPAAIHTLEHLMATWFRNNVDIRGDVVYVGPMGCLTGMYVIMSGIPGKYSVEEMRELVIECLEWILEQTVIPGSNPATCGNCLMHDLPMCKYYCTRYLKNLKEDFHCEYTKLENVSGCGMVFADA